MHSLRVGSTGVVTVSVGPSFHPRRVPLPGGAPVCGSAHRLLFGSFPVWGDDEEGQYRHSPAGLWVNRHLFLFLGGKSWEGGAGLSGESMFPFVRSCQRSPACCTVSRPLSVCLWPGLWTQETSFSAGLPARWSGRLCPSGGRAQCRREEAQIPAQPASITLLPSAFTPGQRTRSAGLSPAAGRFGGGRASTTAGAQRRPAGSSVPRLTGQRFLPRGPVARSGAAAARCPPAPSAPATTPLFAQGLLSFELLGGGVFCLLSAASQRCHREGPTVGAL